MAVTTQRERIDLAGVWNLVFDVENAGIAAGWTGAGYPVQLAKPIAVPGIWNTTYPGVDGVAFYQTAFETPPGWQGKRIELVFEGVAYLASVWVNGQFIGSHEGAYTPFRFDLTGTLNQNGQNQLVVRAAALSKSQAVDGLLLREAPAAKQMWYFPFGGIWGEVYLEALSALACQSVKATPDLAQQQAHLQVTLQNSQPIAQPAELKLAIYNPNGAAVAKRTSPVSIPPGTSRYTYDLSIPNPRLWTCEDPALYRLKVEVAAPASNEADVYETRFGMREFTLRDGEYYLNGEPLYIRGILLQPDYPISVMTPPEKGMLEREIRLAKEAGFNLIRVHLRPAAPGFLDLADELGILIYAETCLGWVKDSPRLMDHGRREITAHIDRDYNHPCVVFWGIYNENPPAANINGQALAKFARSLDPTRVIIHNSGGSLAIDQDFGWIDRTWALPAYETSLQRVMDIHLYLGCSPTASIYRWLQSVGRNSATPTDSFLQGFGSTCVFDEFDREMHTFQGKVFVSEIGCGAFNDMDQTAAGFAGKADLLDARIVRGLRDGLYKGFRERGLEKVFGTPANLFEKTQEMQARGIARQVGAILTNPRISGYIVTQLNDVGWELEAGILDLWRNPKPAYAALKRLNQPHCLISAPHDYAVSAGQTARIDLSLVNRVPLQGNEQVEVVIRNDAGDILSSQVQHPAFGLGLHPLQSISLEGSAGRERCRVSARLLRGHTVLAETEEIIYCLPAVDWEGCRGKIELIGAYPPLFEGEEFRGFFLDPHQHEQNGNTLLVGKPATLSLSEWAAVLRAVEQGSTVLVSGLTPEDKPACEAFTQAGIPVQVYPGVGSWIGCHHWVPDSILTEGLPPVDGLAGETFVDILPRYVLAELGGEVKAGSIRSTQDPYRPKEIVWRSDIEQMPFGKGKVIFCQYRLLEQKPGHPLAARMAYNLFRLANGA